VRGLKGLPPDKALPFGAGTRTAGELLADVEALIALLDEHDDPAALAAAVAERFTANQAAGNDGQGTVLCTGYFEPRLAGSRERTDRFRFPLYRPPGDDVKGRFSRTQIDYGGALEGSGLEIVWLEDDIARFFLHVQGSGRIDLTDGTTIRVGCIDKNGPPYRSIGKLLIAEGIIPEEKMSMQEITRYLTEKPDEIPRVFGHNPSYVFFEERDVPGPLGSLGVPLTPLRSVATDQSVFPKGALLLLRCQKPIAGPDGGVARWEPYTRLVLNQDTGGAIKGPGRVDLFCGGGPQAELTAGHMRHEGALWVLTRKD